MINNDLLCDILKAALDNSHSLVTFPIPRDDEFKKDFFDTLDHMLENSLITSFDVLENKVVLKITPEGIKVANDIY